MAAAIVYLMCAMTSILCVVLLAITYRRSGVKLLLWTAICFSGLALNNILLFVDVIVFPEFDLSILRIFPAVVGIAVLLWGLVWESI